MKTTILNYLLIALTSSLIWSCGGNKTSESTTDKVSNQNKEQIVNKDEDNHVAENNAFGEEFITLKIADDERKKLNTFFSNFSEVMMEPFSDNITDAEIIYFAVYHNKINYYKRFEKTSDSKIRIKQDYINETANKFFGKKVSSHQATGDIAYSNGYYTIEDADGEALYFSHIDELKEAGDNYYFATIDVYVAGSGWTGNYQAKPETWAKDDAPEYHSKMMAFITKTDGRYIINEYLNYKK